jgi:hypothetical protein
LRQKSSRAAESKNIFRLGQLAKLWNADYTTV